MELRALPALVPVSSSHLSLPHLGIKPIFSPESNLATPITFLSGNGFSEGRGSHTFPRLPLPPILHNWNLFITGTTMTLYLF